MKFIVIRRPETNMEAGAPGTPEAPSLKGEQQILDLAKICRDYEVQVVIHSTRLRAAIAARSLAEALGALHIPQDGLEERNFGDWNNREWSQISSELGKLSTEERYTFLPPGGETWQQMEERLQMALAAIAALGYPSVAIVTHWSPIRAILRLLRGEPKESALNYNAGHGEHYVEEYSAMQID